MADWFRRKSWTQSDEEQFFKKLNRARACCAHKYKSLVKIFLFERKVNRINTQFRTINYSLL